VGLLQVVVHYVQRFHQTYVAIFKFFLMVFEMLMDLLHGGVHL
jgi:hypothetical protein